MDLALTEKTVPPDWANKIIHARRTLGENVMMGSDPPPPNYAPPLGFSLSLEVKSFAEGQRIFNVLAEGQDAIHKDFLG